MAKVNVEYKILSKYGSESKYKTLELEGLEDQYAKEEIARIEGVSEQNVLIGSLGNA